jgi:hypothetical protein
VASVARISPFTPEERARILESVAQHTGLKLDDAERLLDSAEGRRVKRDPLLEEQWVKTLHAVSSALCAGSARPSGPYESVFWIRLYGAMTELRRRFESTYELHRDCLAAGKSHPLLAAGAEVFSACSAIRGLLTDDELVFAAFVRHVHAHVYQEGFEYAVEPGNPVHNQPAALRTKQMVRTVQRHVSTDEAHAIVDRICLEYENDDSRIALVFAQRLLPAISRLREAMAALHDERRADRERSLAGRAG